MGANEIFRNNSESLTVRHSQFRVWRLQFGPWGSEAGFLNSVFANSRSTEARPGIQRHAQAILCRSFRGDRVLIFKTLDSASLHSDYARGFVVATHCEMHLFNPARARRSLRRWPVLTSITASACYGRGTQRDRHRPAPLRQDPASSAIFLD